MLESPTVVFMESGYNVYTLQQVARRNWRIGQKQPVDVFFSGYAGSAQYTKLRTNQEEALSHAVVKAVRIWALRHGILFNTLKRNTKQVFRF